MSRLGKPSRILGLNRPSHAGRTEGIENAKNTGPDPAGGPSPNRHLLGSGRVPPSPRGSASTT